MPLLPLEPFLFPEDFLQQTTPPDDGDRCWWVLYTRPRVEKCLARRLLDAQLPFFLPLYQHRWQNRVRQFRSWLPLFPGYVFLHGDGEARLRALQTNLITTVLPVVDQLRLHTDLARVYALIDSNLPLLPEERLEPGMAVEIVRGPLAGLEGKVLRSGKHWRFFVEIQFLQRGVSVEIDGAMIRPLPNRARASLAAAACQ